MKNTFMPIALLGLVIMSMVSCAQEKPATLQEGRALEEQGDYLGAMANYQKMRNPEFRDECLHNLRHLYGDILDAALAQKETPTSAAANYRLGQAYYAQARTFPEYADIIPNAGLDTAAFFAEQRARLQAQAQQALAAATQLQADYQDALLLQGNLYADRSEPDQAVTIYQQLVALRTEAPQAYYQLSVLLYARGQTQEGLELAKMAAATYPDNPDAQLVLGILAAQEGEDAQAVAAFQQTLCRDPRRAEVYDRIAQIYLRQNDFIDAERVFRLGVTNNPAARKLAIFYSALKSILDAQEQAEMQTVYKQIAQETGTAQTPTEAALKAKNLSPALQRLNLGLRLKLLKRQQPYALACAGAAEKSYFTTEIARIQEKIANLPQASQATEPPPAPAK